MRLITPFLVLLSSMTTLAWSWNHPSPTQPLNPLTSPKPTTWNWNTLSITKLNASTTCNAAVLAAFIPPGLPQPAQAFSTHLQQPVCQAPPTLTGLVARNRFQEDYERFAKYFNMHYNQVPKGCQTRFEKVTKEGMIPKSYDEYIRMERKKCEKKVATDQPGDGYSQGGKGHYKHGSAAAGSRGGAMSLVARVAIVGGVMVYAWGRAMI
jgi:hypothetical protein